MQKSDGWVRLPFFGLRNCLLGNAQEACEFVLGESGVDPRLPKKIPGDTSLPRWEFVPPPQGAPLGERSRPATIEAEPAIEWVQWHVYGHWLARSRPETALFRNFVVRRRGCLCDVRGVRLRATPCLPRTYRKIARFHLGNHAVTIQTFRMGTG